MTVTKTKLSVSRERGRNGRIISGVGSGATNGGGGAFGSGINIPGLPLATDFAGKYWVIDKEGSESPEKTPFVEGLPKATFDSMFELVPNNGNPYIRAKYNFASDGEVMAYADSGQLPASIWDALPKASATVLGGIKVGNNLTIDADGTLHATAASGGVSSWNDLSDKPAWLNHATLAAFEGGHGHDWSKITGKPTSYTPSAHVHSWDSITGKPSTFAPSAHTQAISTITGLQSALDGKAPTHNHPYASDTHNHDTKYLGLSGKAADSNLLDGYDSSAFLRKAESTVITGLYTFNVATGDVPFLVVAAKRGRVINLNADLLDGYEASAFPRKAEDTSISAQWRFGTGGLGRLILSDDNYGGELGLITEADASIAVTDAAGKFFYGGLYPGAEVLTIDAQNGFIGINKRNPGCEVDIVGDVRVTKRYQLSTQWQIGYDGTDLVFYNASGVKKAMIDQNGNLTAAGEVTAYGTV